MRNPERGKTLKAVQPLTLILLHWSRL